MKILNTTALILLTYISTGWQQKSYAELYVWPDNYNVTVKPSVANVWEFSYVVSTTEGGLTSGIHSGYFSYDDCKKAVMTLSNQHHVNSYEVSDCYPVSKVVGVN